MADVLTALATLVAGAAVALGVAILLTSRSPRTALAVVLDLLLVAGLLRLGATQTWTAVGTAAAIVIIRRVVGYGLRHSAAEVDRDHPLPG